MADNVFVVNSFNDLKLKSSKGGGFSDGGVINETAVLKEADGPVQVVEIAPPQGEAWGSAVLSFGGEAEAASVSGVNFSPTIDPTVEEYFVKEDGSEVQINSVALGVQPAAGIAGVSTFFEAGGVLQYPNKLRYKFKSGSQPTERVLIKYTLKRFDRPSDQTLSS